MDLTLVLVKLIENGPAILTAVGVLLGAVGSFMTLRASWSNNKKIDTVHTSLQANTKFTLQAKNAAEKANDAAVDTAEKTAQTTETINTRLNGELEQMVERVVRNGMTDLYKTLGELDKRLVALEDCGKCKNFDAKGH